MLEFLEAPFLILHFYCYTLMLEFLEAPFLVLNFSFYTLMLEFLKDLFLVLHFSYYKLMLEFLKAILGPTLFISYINDLHDNVTCNIAIYANDTAL